MKCSFISLLLVFASPSLMAQQTGGMDTVVHTKVLDSVLVLGFIHQTYPVELPPVKGTYLMGGKKSEVIDLAKIPADITNKTGRQLFAKVPGVFVYDMDGSGNQVNIATRGLDPHRGWEFNIRKDGIITNSDMYGYPASHYSMPLESIDHIELVRGTASLQYGAQFGGMLNYVTKQGDTSRPFAFESYNAAGSYNLLSTYNAIGGTIGKLQYYAYFQKKSRDGYRDVEHTNSDAEGVILNYAVTDKFSIRAEYAHSQYQYRLPGALTDSMFAADPRQATRTRNYYSPSIYVPSIKLNWQLAAQTQLQLNTSAILGQRSSVMFDKPTNIKDTINAATLQYNNRQVDIDNYHSYTTELRLLQQYNIGSRVQTLVAGVQYMHNDLHRRQLGKGTTASDYDLSLVTPGWGRDLHFKTKNIAVSVENHFQLTDRLAVNAGARVEVGETNLLGTITYYPENDIPVQVPHKFPLLGANFSYKPAAKSEVYGGIAQAYRPMLLKDLVPSSLYEKVDPAIRDSKGFNAELGFRGNRKFLRWDITAFLLKIDSRFGSLAETDADGNLYLYRTNIGNSLTAGAEIFLQGDWIIGRKIGLSVFTSTSLMHARYVHAEVKSGSNNVDISGNKVESAPDFTTKNGFTVRNGRLSGSLLYSYTSATYADALNTEIPPASTGAVGLVPAYGILDLQASFQLNKHFELKASINNLTNKSYFTKRPSFYPGPGIWSSDGINATGTLIVRI